MPMNSLQVIKAACVEALAESAEDEPGWRAAYISVVGPRTALELVEKVERLEAVVSEEELQSLGTLIRDLTGFIKLKTGDKPDPVRDDLLLQARQLLGLTGL